MLHFHETMGNELIVSEACGFRREFSDDAGYCLDARQFIPAGSTQRIEAHVLAFAASRIAYRI